MEEQLYCGIDGGGTKTSAWVGVKGQPEPIGIGHSGPGNPQAVGIGPATENIEAAIRQALSTAGRQAGQLRHCCLCLAGIGGARERQGVVEWIRRSGVIDAYSLDHDGLTLLAAYYAAQRFATDRPGVSPQSLHGIALIAGTGSFAWGQSDCGLEARAGGHGYLIGDEGSAYAIATAAINAVCRAADGNGPRTKLHDAMLTHCGVDDPRELVSWRYHADTSRPRVAQLARLVFQLYDGDATAAAIITDAAAALGDLVVAVARRLGPAGDGIPLALGGGLFVGSQVYVDLVLENLNQRRFEPCEHVVIEQPVSGALWLAKQRDQSQGI